MKEISLSGEYGHFDPVGREYVITRPDTPRPWFNYLMNDEFVSMISHTGGGVAYYKDPRVYRLLRYRYQNVPYDRPGRYIYIRDNDSGGYWSASWAPTWRKGGDFRCRVGANYQIISYEFDGISAETTYFVPSDRPLEIWDFRIRNLSGRKRDISTFSYAEFAFWGAMRDLMNIDNCPNVSRQRFDKKLEAILHFSYNDTGTGLHDMHFVQNYGFHISNRKIDGYNGDRDKFIGGYRDERDPVAVENGRSSNYCMNGGYPIGSLQHDLRLAPGESVRIVYQTGFGSDEAECRRNCVKYRDESKVDVAFEELKMKWRDIFGKFEVKTPSRAFDASVNSFVQYQAATTLVLSRSISSYEWGIGRAIGFRDSCQDQLGMMHAMPERSRSMLVNLAEGLSADGAASHNFNPFNGQYGNSGFLDDHNCQALTVAAFIKETGEFGFLDERLKYQGTTKTGSMLEHLLAAQDFAWNRRGVNGLMQTGHADWNDSLNPGDGMSESIFTSMLYCASTRELAGLLSFIGRKTLASRLMERCRKVSRICNSKGWDGGWYKRMLRTDGMVLGSRKSRKDSPSIFLEPQAWSVISGVASGEKALKTLNSADKLLGTPYGHKLMDRPFDFFDMDIGSVGIYPGGIKENGSVFNHASSWMIFAESLLGRGDRAFDFFMRMCPVTKNSMADIHESEPYAACQFVSQKPFHVVGRGRNAWLTGTASWMAVGAMQGILGIRADYDGLTVAPAVPKRWKSFKVSRLFRSARYEITVRNPDAISSGDVLIRIKGRPDSMGKIKWDSADAGRTVRVEAVLMGKTNGDGGRCG